ncbi:MAG TPA: histidine phosphatase family protein [Burkholderiaceae bacterium]|nr:histidine phosphatase family protein [Burkholderiaceae bacterium]
MPTRVVLIRHGETAWNRERRLQGHTDVPLNDVGVAQADAMAAALDAWNVTALASSDLMRARQTADPIARRFSLKPMYDTAWRERHYGVFEGLTLDELPHRYPNEYAQWRARDIHAPSPPQGEYLNAFHQRIRRALDALAMRYTQAVVAVVTHGGVLDSVYRIATSTPLDIPRAWPIHNASLNVIDWHAPNHFSLVKWGDITHLENSLDELRERSR